MKVFCIKEGKWTYGKASDDTSPLYGNIYTVEDVFEDWEGVYYHLFEFPPDDEEWICYSSKQFIPISEVEEEVSAEIELLKLIK